MCIFIIYKLVALKRIASTHTLIYVRDTLGIRRVRSEYADIRRCSLHLLYTEAKLYLRYVKNIQRMRANSIYVTHTLTNALQYAGYARHTLIRYSCVIPTLLINYSN